MSIETLLSSLDKVKKTGTNKWTCSCPSHDDKSPSMHVSLLDDGRILINCKAGCDTYSILQAVGLDWSAVFPENSLGDKKSVRQVMYATEALKLIKHEAMIIMACAYALRRKDLTDDDIERASKAMGIINKVIKEAGL
jgi:hypothetical protein